MACLLVTGGAGFIGSCLVRFLLQKRLARVVTLDKLTYAGSLASLRDVLDHPDHTFIQGDVCDVGLLRSILASHCPTGVVHLAAESHVDRSILAPEAFLQSNVVGTFQLLHACLDYWKRLDTADQGQFRFVQVSTDEVYGPMLKGESIETSQYAPSSPYSASKAAADHFTFAFWKTYGLPTIRTHCTNNYGPFQFPEKLIPRMIECALERKPLPVYGDGSQVRDWLFVEDHCRALIAVLDRGLPGESYNIGASCERTNLTVVRSICEILDELQPLAHSSPRSELVQFVQDRPGHDYRYSLNCEKARIQLDWKPTVEFCFGLRRTVAWYLENLRWMSDVKSQCG